MSYRDKLQFVGTGKRRHIEKESYQRLESKDWAAWIKDRLHWNDVLIPYLHDDFGSPRDVFDTLARELSDEVREVLYDGIRISLDEAYTTLQRHRERWPEESISELLFLVVDSGYDSGYDEAGAYSTHHTRKDPHPFYQDREKIKKYLDVLEPKQKNNECETGSYNGDLYSMVLKTLCEVGAKEPYSFWQEQLRKSEGRYAGICFLALDQNSPLEALHLLHDIHWDDNAVLENMKLPLWYFYDTHKDEPQIMEKMEEEIAKLPEHARKAIEEAELLTSDE